MPKNLNELTQCCKEEWTNNLFTSIKETYTVIQETITSMLFFYKLFSPGDTWYCLYVFSVWLNFAKQIMACLRLYLPNNKTHYNQINSYFFSHKNHRLKVKDSILNLTVDTDHSLCCKRSSSHNDLLHYCNYSTVISGSSYVRFALRLRSRPGIR